MFWNFLNVCLCVCVFLPLQRPAGPQAAAAREAEHVAAQGAGHTQAAVGTDIPRGKHTHARTHTRACVYLPLEGTPINGINFNLMQF